MFIPTRAIRFDPPTRRAVSSLLTSHTLSGANPRSSTITGPLRALFSTPCLVYYSCPSMPMLPSSRNFYLLQPHLCSIVSHSREVCRECSDSPVGTHHN